MATRGGDKRRSAKQEELKEEEKTSKTEARSKLNKALENVEAEKEKEQELGEPSSSESEKQEESVPHKKTKVKAEKEDSPVVKEQKIPKLPKPSQQASYIMKLFDRSVNLAKFTEDIPLYPLCRSWMSNAPRQLPMKTEKSIDAVLHVEEGDVVEMPKVRIRKGGKSLIRKETKINKKDFDKIIDSEVWTQEKLFEFHRGRWNEERAKAIENSKTFEEKHFAANFELLESLIKGNEE